MLCFGSASASALKLPATELRFTTTGTPLRCMPADAWVQHVALINNIQMWKPISVNSRDGEDGEDGEDVVLVAEKKTKHITKIVLLIAQSITIIVGGVIVGVRVN